MNRYVVAGVLADVEAGRRVLVITENAQESRVLLAQLLDAAEVAGLLVEARIRRGSGVESVELPAGGWVRFRSRRQSTRGMSADVVFIDGDASPAVVAELRLVVMASPHRGEVIRR